MLYNIALVFDGVDAWAFEGFAQAHCLARADGYCLSARALAHVTLAQFEYDGAREALLAGLPKVLDVEVGLMGVARRVGAGAHKGKDWIEVRVEASPALVGVHGEVCAYLAALGIEPLGRHGAAYQPHVTLCRVEAGVDVAGAFGDDPFKGQRLRGRVAMGRSDECGQLVEVF